MLHWAWQDGRGGDKACQIKSFHALQGFTLLSTLVVIGCIAIIMLLAIGSMSHVGNLAKSDLKKLTLEFLYLQRCALATGKPQKLTFNLTQGSYQVNDRVERLSRGVTFKAPTSAQGPPSSLEQRIVKPITFDKSSVLFYSDGKMQPGAVYLSHESLPYSYALTVPVSHVSNIYTYRFSKGHWERI